MEGVIAFQDPKTEEELVNAAEKGKGNQTGGAAGREAWTPLLGDWVGGGQRWILGYVLGGWG